MNNLKEIRKKNNLTQQEVAKELNLNQQAYSRYETGVSEPDLKTLKDMADFFQTSIDEIVGRETDEINLNSIPEYKKNIIKLILACSRIECEKIEAFYLGRKESEKERLEEEKQKRTERLKKEYEIMKNKERQQ